MNRSKSWRRFPSDEGADFKEDKRATSHPNLSASFSTAELRASRHHSAEDLRRKIVSLNKELEIEKAFAKQLRREKSLDLKHAREEEQRRAASMQTELKTKLHKEKTNELSALKEQLHKDKEKEIVQIIKQKDDVLRAAQQSWGKEKDELRGKIRGEVWSEARDESRKEFDRERTRLEQEILDLKMQKKELEEAYKILQEADKRKTDEIRRIFHEHEIELEKFKRNSWEESRRQMGEIRQLLNIIEQLERKLGIDSGHINKLRMEKEGLYEELKKKTNTFDAWDSMMSSSVKVEGCASGPTIPPPHTDPKYHGVSHEIRTLQRKNTELSSLVKKLDEKNQQLATKNAELLSELERSDKEARDKCKKLEKKNLEITQNTKKLESKNKALQEEITTLKRRPGAVYSGKDIGGKKAAVRPRGQGMSQTDGPEIARLKQQIKDQSKTIEELKQNLMEKERRIDLLKQRKKGGKKPKLARTSVDAVLQQEHDDAASGVSDVSSDISEMSSTDSSSNASKLKKLTKELLALERAYALLQAQVGGTVDVEREEMERQQLQSDLIESQTRIHELERMMDNNAQGGSEDLQQLQHDNKILYQKLIAAESERDRALSELSKNTEDLRDLQDKKDLLEFELEEMSQMSFAGSEDEFASPRKTRDKEDRKLPLSFEEVKAYLEEIENEKANVLTVMEIEALKQARTSLTAFPQKISHLEATEAVLRSKVKDLEERHLQDSEGPMQYDSHMGEPETLSEVLELDAAANKNHTDSTQNKTDFTLIDIDQHFQEKELIDKKCGTELTCTLLCDMERMYDKFLRDHKEEAETLYHKPIIPFDTEKSDAECMTDFEWHDHQQGSACLFHTPIITFDTEKSDAECMTEFIWEDIVEIEETYQEFLTNIEGLELNLAKAGVKMVDKRTVTDLIWDDITALENKGKQLDELQESVSREKDVEKYEQESNTDVIQCFERESNTEVIEKHEVECNTDLTCDDMIEEKRNSRVIMLKAERLESELSKTFCDKKDEEIMTDIQWKDVVKQEEIVGLQDLLVLEQGQRKEDEIKLVDYQVLKEANATTKTAEISILTDSVWIVDPAERLERIVKDLVVKTMNGAVADIAGETIDDLQHCLLVRMSVCQEDQQTGTDVTGEYMETLLANTSELTRLTDLVEERENRLKKLEDELANTLVGKDELETMTDLMREEFTERKEMYKSQIDELRESLSTERQLRQNNEMKLLEYDALKEADMNRLCEDKNRSAVTDISDMETDMDQLNEDKSSMTDLVWVKDSDEVLEGTAREIVERAMNKANVKVANDIICDLRNGPVVTKNDKETITDILDKDLQNLQKDAQRNILELGKMTEVNGELQNELSKVVSEKKELEGMIDMIRKHFFENDKIHEEQVEKLQKQIRIKQGTREADKMKLAEYEVLKEKMYDDKIVMTESIWIVERMVKQTVEEAKNEALFEVAKEDLKEIIQTGIREMEILREAVKDRERRLNELETVLSKSAIRENELQDANNHLREELSIVEQLQDQIEELKEQLTMEQDITGKQRDENRHIKDEKEDVVTVDEIQTCEKDMSWTEVVEVEEKYEEFRDNIQEIQEKLAKADVEKNEVEVMNSLTEMAKMKDADERKEQMIQELQDDISRSTVTKTEVCTDDLENTRQQVECSIKCDKKVMTDMSWTEVMEVEEKYQEFRDNIQEIQEKLAKADVEKNEVEVMTDLIWEDFCNQEQLYKEQIEEIQEQLMLKQMMSEDYKMRLLEYKALRESTLVIQGEDKSVTTESVCIKTREGALQSVVVELGERAKHGAIVELATEAVFNRTKEDKAMMTEFSWKEIEYLEKTYREWVEELRQMKEDLRRKQLEKHDKSCMTEIPTVNTADAELMTDLESSNIRQVLELQALKDANANQGPTEEKTTMTELKWEDIPYLEMSCTKKLQELEVIAEGTHDVEHDGVNKQSMTDLSWQDGEHFEKSYQEELDKLEVLATSLNENEKKGKDQDVMTELKWDEVECQVESYENRDQINHLNGLLEDKRYHKESLLTETMAVELQGKNMGQLELSMDFDSMEDMGDLQHKDIEKERIKDAECVTELTLKDMLSIETKLIIFEEEGVDKECMTELSHEDISAIEDVVMKQTERLENKVDESCMTDLLFGDIERLQKLKEQQLTDTKDNEHVQANISSGDLGRGQDKNELEQFYRITDGDERQNAEDTLEPTEPRTSTRLTDFPFTEGLDDSLIREDSSLSRIADVNERYTSTDITLEDILYFEDLEIKHHELLLKIKQQGTRSPVDGSSHAVDKGMEKTDQETSTDLTLAGLSYYENLEGEYHEMTLEKKNTQLEGAGMHSKGPSRTTVDIKEFDNLKRKCEKLLEEKERRDAEGSAPGMTSIDVRDYENLNEKYNKLLLEKEQWTAARAEQGLTSVDQEHYENMKEQMNDLLLEKEQWEGEQEHYENMKEQMNDLLLEKEQWEGEQEHYENMKEQMNDLLLEKEQWEGEQEHYENMKEQMNVLLLEKEQWEGEQEHYENMKEQMNVLLLEKEQWEGEQEHYENMKEQMNDLLLEKEQWEGEQEHYENMKEQMNDLLLEKEQWEGEQEHYENMKEQMNDLLLEKEQWEGEQEHYENMKEQMNDLLLEKEQWEGEQNKQQQTSVDVKEHENMKEQLFQLLSEKELWKSVQSDQQDNENLKGKYNKLLIEKERWETAHSKMGLGPDDRKEYENLKEQYNELLSEKEHLKAVTLQNIKNEVGTSTDLTLEDFEYYENVELDYRDLQESHRQLAQEYDALCSGKNSTDKATGTDLSLDDIQCLQDAENEYKNLLLTRPHEGKDQGVCTDMTMGRLQYLEDVESVHKKCGPGKSTHVGTTTDLALADLHYLEEVEAVHQQCMTTVDNDISSSKTDTSDMGVGTELTASVLEYLEEVAVAHEEIVREYEAFRRSVTKETEDANLMTEMTGRHLDSLEHVAAKSEELEKMALQMAEEKRREERRRDSTLMTDLTLEKLKNLETSDNIFTELRDRGMLWRLEQLRKPKQKYGTVTDLLVSSIEYLEDIERLYREQETRRNNMREKSVETDMTQTDLKRMENLANNAVDNKTKIEEKVTAETSPDLVDGRRRHGDARGVCTVEIGIQCELRDLLSIIREQHEQDGGSADTKWFFSELNKKSKEGFEPVEVVLRHGIRNSSTPEVNKRYSLDSKRHSSNMSLNLDYGWTSTSSLDISGLDKTPLRGSGLGRWDSPRVPLAQDETFDLSDIESAPSEEFLHQAMQASGRGETAVTQFDRYIMARKQSEKELLADIRENEEQEETGEGLHQLKSIAELLKENERLKIRNVELELLVAQKGDLSEDELQLLKQKIQQLREAEERMEKLHDSNAALKDRINKLQEETLQSGPSTSRSARDNWSEMDPSEGRTRLLLVQDWGLGESDLDSLFSAREGTVSPAESIETAALRRLLDEYAKSDHATQSGPVPGVCQDIQTTGDMVKLIDLSYDGTIPDYIAKELEKLKAENSELYQELLELRKLKLDNSAASLQRSRDNRLEEPIKASEQSKAESQDDWLTKLESLSDDRSSKHRIDGKKPKVHVKDFDELFAESAPKPKGARKQFPTRSKVKEPEVRSSRSSRDTKAAVQRGLSNLEAMDGQQNIRQRADTDDILDFEFADDAPPDFAPPPVPSETPPDLPDKNQDDVDLGTEPILGSSPPRDSKALRAALRQKNYPGVITAVSEPNVQADKEANVERQPGLEGTKIPPALRTNQMSYLHRPQAATKPVPPPTLPKPKMTGRRVPVTPKSGLLSTPLTRSRESLNDEEGLGLTPRGYVRATASAINQGELDALGEKINFLEKQLKNKENMIRSMKAEASELEKQALLERREREIKILEDDVAFLKQENHKKERELLTKIGELNRKSYEADQWKAEANNSEKQRKRIETSYLNLQAQTRSLQGSDSKLSGLQSKYSTLEKENKQLSEKVKNLEKTEKEFKQLEYNISVLQNHLQDMESVEKERDDLLKKLKIVEDQRDDLLKKGRMVESERNDFLRNNKIMEMQRDELEQRYAIAHKNQIELKAAAEEMEGKIQDAQHERNFVQAQYNKLEAEKDELEKRLAAVTRERNALETRLAELEDRSREYVKLEDGFHTLRLKAAELTRQRDDFEMQIPTLKAKVALLKKACKEKDEFIDKQNDEIRELRHAIATSTLDDLSKIRSYGYSPENFVKYSGKRDESKNDVTNGTGDTVNSRSPCRSKSRNPPPKMFVVIFDYDPRKASVSGCPESELTLKEGDELMVYGDMDSNGCYEAELNGVRGLVPGLYVEEVEDAPVHSLANGTNGHEKERPVKGRLTNGHAEPDAISSSHSSMSPRSSCPDTDLQRQCFVALYDYNPFQSCTTGRPDLELPLKKGDIMTVIGDMDTNGYYKAEMDGLNGLVPSNFVEDVTSSSFLQTTSTTAPEQILGMLDNIKVTSPQRSGMSLPLPMPALSNAGPSFSTQPTPASIVPSGHMGQPVPMVTMITPRREQAIQPIFTPYVSPAEVHKLAAPISTASNKPCAKASQESPRQQTATSPRPRGITSQSSPSKHPIPSQPMTSPPQITSQVQRSSVQPVSKPKPRQSKALVTRPQSVGHRGAPDPPSSLRVLRPVNHDAILLGWSLPPMDEFGRSNGVVVKGFKIYENGEYKMNVRSQFMTKALVDDLDLRYPIQFTIRTIGSDGSNSNDVSTTFTDTINNSRMSVSKAIQDTVGNSKQVRIYVALYDYDPMKSSPNTNPQYELKFIEGDILRVEDTSRKDGFYFGSLNDKKGLIPSNFVEEVAVAKALAPPSSTAKGGSRAIMNLTSTPNPTSRHRKMVALYDYSPSEQSPLDNHHDELPFRKGQEITITGTMNKDGYYNAEINDRKGLVPATFLESPHDATNGTNKKYRS